MPCRKCPLQGFGRCWPIRQHLRESKWYRFLQHGQVRWIAGLVNVTASVAVAGTTAMTVLYLTQIGTQRSTLHNVQTTRPRPSCRLTARCKPWPARPCQRPQRQGLDCSWQAHEFIRGWLTDRKHSFVLSWENSGLLTLRVNGDGGRSVQQFHVGYSVRRRRHGDDC